MFISVFRAVRWMDRQAPRSGMPAAPGDQAGEVSGAGLVEEAAKPSATCSKKPSGARAS
jgi:hypothetical protein